MKLAIIIKKSTKLIKKMKLVGKIRKNYKMSDNQIIRK